VLSLSRAMGVGTMVPATGMSSASGIAYTEETWTPATGRPKAFLPPTMVGADSVIIALKESATPRTIGLSATKVIDNSRDWRRRLFRVTATAATSDFCWNGSGNNFPNHTIAQVQASANSFNLAYAGTDSLIITLSSSNLPLVAAGANVYIYVDHTTGYLMGNVAATDPACNFVIWIEASGQFNDAF